MAYQWASLNISSTDLPPIALPNIISDLRPTEAWVTLPPFPRHLGGQVTGFSVSATTEALDSRPRAPGFPLCPGFFRPEPDRDFESFRARNPASRNSRLAFWDRSRLDTRSPVDQYVRC